MDLAAKVGAPFIGLNDGAGARIQEGVVSLGGYGDVFLRNVLASGVIPQISAIMGPCAGGAVYSPAMTDFIIMVKNTSNMFITGPDVIKTVTHEEVTAEELGGAVAHASKSGVADFAAEHEEECIQIIRNLLSFIPQNNLEDPPFVATEDPTDRQDPALRTLVPDNANKPYDIKELIKLVVDDGNFLEVHPLYGKNMVVGFARFGGRSVGIVANQPAHRAGVPRHRRLEEGRRASCASATPSTSRSSPSSTCRASCPASTRSTAASSSTARSCSTPSARRPCRASRSSPARPTAAPTSS